MPKKKDITGQRFGALTVIRRADAPNPNPYHRTFWLVRCDCGREAVMQQCWVSRRKRCAECGRKARAEGLRGKRNPNRMDLTGRKFGRLIVLCEAEPQGKTRFWQCRCECGNQTTVEQASLRSGNTKSCGCLKREIIRRPRRHGAASRNRADRAEEYGIWQGMITRCTNPNRETWERYGGRGITVCERWRHSFPNFLADIGPRPSPDHTLDRIDSNGDYEPGNVRWATRAEQARNVRRNINITINGVTKTLTDWARENGIGISTAYSRIRLGWDPVEAVTAPPLQKWNPHVKHGENA